MLSKGKQVYANTPLPRYLNGKTLVPTIIPCVEPEGAQGHGDTAEGDAKPAAKVKDPLRWFGVLVPSQLRQAKRDFQAGMWRSEAKALAILREMS
jgi:hypothetical protein